MAISIFKTLRKQVGATTVEFYIIAFFVLIPMIMAVMQMGLFMLAKNAVNLAAFTAARAGAASGGNPEEMRRNLLNALSSLYIARGLGMVNSVGLSDLGKDNFRIVMDAAYQAAAIDWARPTNHLKVLNPGVEAFRDFGIKNPHGNGRIIPVTNVLNDMSVGSYSQQTRADALLLKVEVRYCYEMVFPVIDEAVGIMLGGIFSSVEDNLCYARTPPNNRRGIPIVSHAVIRMTTPPLQSYF